MIVTIVLATFGLTAFLLWSLSYVLHRQERELTVQNNSASSTAEAVTLKSLNYKDPNTIGASRSSQATDNETDYAASEWERRDTKKRHQQKDLHPWIPR